MAISIICPGCGKRLQTLREPAAGSELKCPKCEQKFSYQAQVETPPFASPVVASRTVAQKQRTVQALKKVVAAEEDAEESEAQPSSGSWAKLLVFVVVLFGAVAAGGYYFGQEHLKKLGLFAERKVPPQDDSNKRADGPVEPGPGEGNPPHQAPEIAWDQAFAKAAAQPVDDPKADPAIQPEGEPVVANQGVVDTATEGNEPIRPKRFGTKGTDGTLLDPLGNKILDVEFSPDGKVLATFDAAGQTTLWDLKTKQAVDISFQHHGGQADTQNARHLAFSRDGRTLVFGSTNVVTVADLPAAKMRWKKGTVVVSSALHVSPSARYVMLHESDEQGVSSTIATICDVSSGKVLLKIPEAGDIYSEMLIFSPDDKLLALKDDLHEKIRLFELPSGKELDGINGVRGGQSMMFSGDGRTMILPNENMERHLWDLSVPSQPRFDYRSPPQDSNPSWQTILSPDGKTVADLPEMWDIEKREVTAKFDGDCAFGQFSPDGKLIAYWGSEVNVADAGTGQTLTVLNAGKSGELTLRKPTCVAFSPDNNLVAIGTDSGNVVLKTISASTPTTGTVAATNAGKAAHAEVALEFTEPANLANYFSSSHTPRRFANKVWMSPDRRWIITSDSYATLWNLEEGKQHMVLTLNDGQGTRINQLSQPNPAFPDSNVAFALHNIQGWRFHNDGRMLSVMSQGSQVHYDLVAGTHVFDGADPEFEGNKLSWDGKVAATWVVAYVPGGIQNRAEAAKQISYKYRQPAGRAKAPDIRWELVMLDVGTGKKLKSFGLFDRQVVRAFRYPAFPTMSFSADNKRLAVVAFDLQGNRPSEPRVHVWDWESGKEYLMTTPVEDLYQLELIDNGKTLVAITGRSGTNGIGSGTYRATYYDVERGSRGGEILLDKGHTGRILAVAFDPVEPRFVTADEHGMLLVRDQKTGDPLARHKAHNDGITAVCFSSDRKQIVTAARDRTVKVWDVQSLLQGK